MSDLCRLIWCALIGIFRPRAALQAEILVLRHQLNVLRRKSPKRLVFGNIDRLVFAALYDVLLQRGSHAPIAAQGRADPTCRSDRWSHAGRASSGWTTPPIFQGVSFR
jgi:hypothetical protein